MKIGYFGKQISFALEMLRRLRLEHSPDEFLKCQPGDKAPSRELEVIIAFGKVDPTDLMLDGTVKYLGEVLAKYRDGLLSEGIVNEPKNARVHLRESLIFNDVLRPNGGSA
jgi:hypothetical protein